MELIYIYIIFISCLIRINAHYILIPFDSMVYNPNNDPKINTDYLSTIFSEDIYFNLTLGNPKQIIKTFIRLDEYELRVKEPKYMSSLSKSFKPDIKGDKIISKENFYFMTISTQEDLNNFLHSDTTNTTNKEKEMIKEYKNVTFVYLNTTTNNKFLEHELLEPELNKLLKANYSKLGFRNRNLNWDSHPNFLGNLKNLKHINTSIFSFVFNKDKNAEHLGYLIIGDLFIDKEKEYEEVNKTNFALRGGGVSWDLTISTIYSESNKENMNSFYQRSVSAELQVELSYILGSKYYKEFIEKEFFNELVDKKICQYKNILVDLSFGTYVCDGKSNIFLDYYNNKFPNLVFVLNNIDDKLILTKEDLFINNPYNKSDTNIYFRVYFHIIITTTWKLGRVFLKNYRLSFNDEQKLILYHRNKIIEKIKDNTVSQPHDANDNKNNILKIFFIIFLAVVIFSLGFFFHKSIIKKPRKTKANELDDGFDYQNDNKNKSLNKELDINNEDIDRNEKSLYLELGTKNI